MGMIVIFHGSGMRTGCAFRENMIQCEGRFLRSKTWNIAPNVTMSGFHAVNSNELLEEL